MVALFKAAALNWMKDHAQSMGAALAFYTIFSIAPLLLIVIAIAGFVFGEDAARGEIYGQLQGMLGTTGALAVQGLLESAGRRSRERACGGRSACCVLFIGATSVFAELQDALDRIWRAPQRPRARRPVARCCAARLLSFGMILGIGFLLIVSLAFSAALSALSRWWDPESHSWITFSGATELGLSFVLVTVVFAMIYKTMPRVQHRLARRVGRRGRHLAAVHRRQDADRPVHRPQRHHLGLRRGGLADRGAAVGVLLGADLPVRRRVHLGLFAPLRLAPAAARRDAAAQRRRR